uniref:14-3-3 domain-containing protein n=1 Tax=Arcella intermedia TaxID=1963864 RepID=A0A6B2LTP8_9EUKA
MSGPRVPDTAALALVAYMKGKELAEVHLRPAHPVRLGIIYHLSVLYEEILKERKKAIEINHKAFDLAIGDLEHLSNESYKDSALILQLMRPLYFNI